MITPDLILSTARSYEGRKYVSRKFDCVIFLAQVLSDLGICINDKMRNQIYVEIDEFDETLDELVESNHFITQGIAIAISDYNLGTIVDLDNAMPGDFVQYWWKKDDSWKGHAAIIETVSDNGTFDLYGAHSSKLGVTTLHDVTLKEPEMKVYVGRLD